MVSHTYSSNIWQVGALDCSVLEANLGQGYLAKLFKKCLLLLLKVELKVLQDPGIQCPSGCPFSLCLCHPVAGSGFIHEPLLSEWC